MDKVHVSLGHEKQFTGKAREEDSGQFVTTRQCEGKRTHMYS